MADLELMDKELQRKYPDAAAWNARERGERARNKEIDGLGQVQGCRDVKLLQPLKDPRGCFSSSSGLQAAASS
jgi:hypothetical protein